MAGASAEPLIHGPSAISVHNDANMVYYAILGFDGACVSHSLRPAIFCSIENALSKNGVKRSLRKHDLKG